MKTISKSEWMEALYFPFDKKNTMAWRNRASWRTALDTLVQAAQEAQTSLKARDDGEYMPELLEQAALCLTEIQEAFDKLKQLTIP